MHWTYKHRLGILTVLLFVCLVSSPAIGQIPSQPHDYVTDLAAIIDDDTEARLNRYLRELEQKTTVQIMVLTLMDLQGSAIEDLSIHIAHDTWKIGQKGKDNGALLLVAYGDRKYRFEIGYGLEGILPDSLVGAIGRTHLVRNFRKGDYSRGIYEAVMAMITPVARYAGVQISEVPSIQHRLAVKEESTVHKPLNTITTIIVVILLLILIFRFPRFFLFLLLMLAMGGRGGGSWGGGRGGFGGGGGGFGGGGASGGW